jgi:hypothetical protein
VYFQLVVAPAMLPIKPLVLAETGVGFFNALVGLVWEDAVWELMLRLDRRYKVAVLRRNRAGDVGEVVNLEFTSSHDAAIGMCVAILAAWHAGSTYRDRTPMRARDIRRAIRSSRRKTG